MWCSADSDPDLFRYSLAGQGRLGWIKSFEGISYGRGMLTDDAVYVPVEDSILRLDLASPLDQSAIQQHQLTIGPQDMAGTRDATGGPVEFYVHGSPCYRPECISNPG